MQGIITKGIGGFYYVQVPGKGLYECKARGVFRGRGEKPLVGDRVEIVALSQEGAPTGNLTELFKRTNRLIRPEVANVDQALVVFAALSPEPNLGLLDQFLLAMHQQGIPVLLCFNKIDIAQKEKLLDFQKIYEKAGCRILFASALEDQGIAAIGEALRGKTTVLAGPSGVGKSSLLNRLLGETRMETGSVSKKIGRGKHTTRHSELFPLSGNWEEAEGWIFDTPGFSSFQVQEMEPEELKEHFPEFTPYEGECRFTGCYHRKEPGCAVKQAVEEGKITKERYDSYLGILEQLEEKKKRNRRI